MGARDPGARCRRASEILADDFLVTSVLRPELAHDRAAWLRNLPQVETESISFHGLRARVFADIAVVTGRLDWEAVWSGEDVSDVYLVTDVWVRHDDRWRVSWRASFRASGAIRRVHLAGDESRVENP